VPAPSRSATLARQLEDAATALIELVASVDAAAWTRISKPGVWSASKDAEHAVDGARLHLWIVRVTLGERAGPRPSIERRALVAEQSREAVVDLIRKRTAEGRQLVAALTDEQLELPAKPPRDRPRTLAQMIEGQLIGHILTHRDAIAAKLKAQ
jgi:hypothetical protein